MTTKTKDIPAFTIPDSTDVPADKWLDEQTFPFNGNLWRINPDFSITKVRPTPTDGHLDVKSQREFIRNKYTFGKG